MQLWENDLYIFTYEEYNRLPEGIELTSIFGEKVIKGSTAHIDMDTRFGHIAFGVNDPWNHPLKDLFLIFKLTQ